MIPISSPTPLTGIIPQAVNVDLTKLDEQEKNVYLAICKYYMAQFMPPAVKKKTKFSAPTGDGGTVEAVSTVVTQPGYYYYDYDRYGDYMSVGVDAGDSNMVYLNPQAYVYGYPDAKVGFYITATRGNIIMANENWAGVNDGENASHQYFMINWTYDELVPADYQDGQGFGIAWQDNFLEDGQYAGADIYIRAIDLSNRYKLLTAAKATIAYDPEANTYRLAGVWNEDVSATGQMSEEDRAELVIRAYDLATNKVYFPNQVVVNKLSALGTKEEITGQAIVEYLGKTMHFPEFSSASGQPVRSSFYADWFDDIYAVSLPIREKGFITLYYSADAVPLIESSLAPADVVDISPATSLGLNFFGTDFYCPETRTR